MAPTRTSSFSGAVFTCHKLRVHRFVEKSEIWISESASSIHDFCHIEEGPDCFPSSVGNDDVGCGDGLTQQSIS